MPSDLAGLLTARLQRPSGSTVNRPALRKALSGVVATIRDLGPAPRTLHDEIVSLRRELDEREITVGKRTYVLGDMVRDAANARSRPWNTTIDPNLLLSHIRSRYNTYVADDMYWWLVVLGVLRFKTIDDFTSSKGWHWTDSWSYPA